MEGVLLSDRATDWIEAVANGESRRIAVLVMRAAGSSDVLVPVRDITVYSGWGGWG